MTLNGASKEGIRRILDTWQFWIGVAYFGLVCVVVALWIGFSRVSTDQARTERIQAARHADIVANADAQYQQCVKSIPTLRRVDGFLEGVREVHHILLVNSEASHQATPPGSALYQTQKRNIERLRDAFKKVNGVKFPIPTHSSCVALRNRLEAKQ